MAYGLYPWAGVGDNAALLGQWNRVLSLPGWCHAALGLQSDLQTDIDNRRALPILRAQVSGSAPPPEGFGRRSRMTDCNQ